MCGINGFNFKSTDLIEDMNNSIKHRGPDGSGVMLNNLVSFGHVRLSIVDLSDAGHQPMYYNKSSGGCNDLFLKNNIESSNLSITFNGEIYNYVDIKSELVNKGYNFSTETDTEVILASYLEWGEDCVNKFNGMWAFSIFDMEKNILFCSRDRLGVKPFYYFCDDEKFIFSSEVKGILKHDYVKNNLKINNISVELYFSLGFIPFPYSIYEGIFKLEPSQNLVYDISLNKIIKKYKYYEIPDFTPCLSKTDAESKIKELLFDSCKLRLMADVKVGAFLSGGVDSSSVVSYMKKIIGSDLLNTFSIGFDGKFDETKYVDMVVDKIKPCNHHKYFKKEDFLNFLRDYNESFDEPCSDFSGFAGLKVADFAKCDVSVSLSGDGGDEIFGGYMNHINGQKINLINNIPKFVRNLSFDFLSKINLDKLSQIKNGFNVSLNDPSKYYLLNNDFILYEPKSYKMWLEKTMIYSLKKGNNNISESLRIHDLLFNTLPDKYLTKVDRTSMRFGLEVRSPYLDYRFVELTQSIPTKYKSNIFQGKIILKKVLKDDLPSSVLYRKKQGFTPPIKGWILEDEKNILQMKKFLSKLFDLKVIDKELFDFYNDILFNGSDFYDVYKIRLYFFMVWFERWMK